MPLPLILAMIVFLVLAGGILLGGVFVRKMILGTQYGRRDRAIPNRAVWLIRLAAGAPPCINCIGSVLAARQAPVESYWP